MSTVSRRQWLGIGAIALLAALFGFFNAGERVVLHMGIFVLYQVSLVVLIFVAFLLGMVAMFLVGLRHDMRIRAILHERGFDVPAPQATPAVHREEPARAVQPPVYGEEPIAPAPPPPSGYPTYLPPDPEP